MRYMVVIEEGQHIPVPHSSSSFVLRSKSDKSVKGMSL